MKIKRIDVLGVPFDNVTMEEAVSRAEVLLSQPEPSRVVTPNAEIVYTCLNNKAAFEAVVTADLILPDGIGIIKGADMLRRPLKERVSGCDFAEELLEYLSHRSESVFLLGAKPAENGRLSVAAEAAEKLCEKYPGLHIAGTPDGYFSGDEAIVEEINNSGADVLFVALGSPRQELWMHKNAPKLRCRLMAGLGGSLDVMAGRVIRAPHIWQKMGLEWLYRMLKEPVRFKRFGALPRFMLEVSKQKKRENNNGRA